MALGDILLGSGTVITVGATSPANIDVVGLNRWGAPRSKPVNIRKYYPPTTPKTITGQSEDTFELSGDLGSVDDGQRFIYARYADDATFFIRILDSEGNGFEQEVRATRWEPSGPNPDDPNALTVAFGGVADPTLIGSGF